MRIKHRILLFGFAKLLKTVSEPNAFEFKFPAVQVFKPAGFGCEVEDELIGAKALFFESAFFVQLIFAVFSVAEQRMAD